MIYNIHTHHISNNKNITEIVNKYPNDLIENNIIHSIGIHPWFINKQDSTKQLNIIQKQSKNNHCIAIGECGLDKKIAVDIELQKTVFIEQIKIAIEVEKPMIIHCVGAFQELIEIRKKIPKKAVMIIHGFSKNSQVAEMLIKFGCYLSFGSLLLKNINIQNTLKSIPKEYFFLETDNNQEHSIFEIYEKATSLLKIDVVSQIENNFNQLFKK